MECSQSAITKITRQTCSIWSNSREIPQASNDASVAFFGLQHSGYSISSDMTAGYWVQSHCSHLNRYKCIQYGLEIIKIDQLINGTWSSLVMSNDLAFNLVIIEPISGESHAKYMIPNVWKKSIKFPQSVMVWGCMSAISISKICLLKRSINAAVYQDI